MASRRRKQTTKRPKLSIPVEHLRERVVRNRTLNVRITEMERNQIHDAAKHMGVNISDYILGLHAEAWEQIQKGKV